MELPVTDEEKRSKLAASQILDWNDFKMVLSKNEKDYEKKSLIRNLREVVSRNKKRFHDGHYNLDLSCDF